MYKDEVVYDISSEDYHGMKGSYSSSQLKSLMDDPEEFVAKYINKTVEKEENPAFDIGTYFHTSILEPHKMQDECAVYKGIRRGKEWEKFKAENANKAIITESELNQANTLVAAVQKSKIATGYLKSSRPEVSCFAEVGVSGRIIFSKKFNKILHPTGWVSVDSGAIDILASARDTVYILLKVRADSIGDDFILDLKSTTGNCKSKKSMQRKVTDLNYDLSAALYLDIFSLVLQKDLTRFLWVFASKDVGNSKTYEATAKNILVGRSKWRKAVFALADGIRSNWDIPDTLGFLDPQYSELEHLEQQAEDIL